MEGTFLIQFVNENVTYFWIGSFNSIKIAYNRQVCKFSKYTKHKMLTILLNIHKFTPFWNECNARKPFVMNTRKFQNNNWNEITSVIICCFYNIFLLVYKSFVYFIIFLCVLKFSFSKFLMNFNRNLLRLLKYYFDEHLFCMNIDDDILCGANASKCSKFLFEWFGI